MNGNHQGRADPPAPRLGLHAQSQERAVLELGASWRALQALAILSLFGRAPEAGGTLARVL